jgi:hypothetical protein
MSSVTPIRSGEPPPKPPEPKKSRMRKSRCQGKFMLDDPPDGPGTLRLIQALCGVCKAVELLAPQHRDDDIDLPLQLGTAAQILSDMLQNRITVLP